MQLCVRNFSLEYFATLGGNVTLVQGLGLDLARNHDPSLLVQYEESLLGMTWMPILNNIVKQPALP